MTEEQNTRLECLHLASKSCGEDISHKYVLEVAKDFYNFVYGAAQAFKVVSNDEGA